MTSLFRLVLLAALAAALAVTPAAQAGQVFDAALLSPPGLSYADDAGDAAGLTVTWDATARTATFTDTAQPIDAAPDFCTATPAATVTCTIANDRPVPMLRVFANDGDDRITVDGALRTEIDAGPGDDTVRGGAGNDLVLPRGGDDDVDGRGGSDLVYAAEQTAQPDGADTYADSGTSGFDVLTWFFLSDDAGTDVTVDGEANDGNVTRDSGGTDDVGIGFDKLEGSAYADDITGGAAAETISGAAGNDRVDGGTGADTLVGGAGDDTLEARDGGVDAELDCDAGGNQGTADVAAVDAADPIPADCETVTREGGGGGGSGGDTGGGGGTGSGGGPTTTPPTAVQPQVNPFAGTGAAVLAVASTQQAATMPAVVGRPVETARRLVGERISATDLDVVFQRGCKASQDLEVLRQRPAKGARLDVAAGRPAAVRLTVCVAERDFLADCDLKDLRSDLKDLPKRADADLGMAILDRFGRCKVDYDVKLARKAEEARMALEAQKAGEKQRARVKGKGLIRSALTCPSAPQEQDLTLTLTEGQVADQRLFGLRASGPGGWQIPAGETSYVDVLVRDKGLPAHAVEATIYTDGDDVGMAGGARDAPLQTAQAKVAKDGYARLILSPTKAGVIPVCAVLRTGEDEAMTAALKLRVAPRPTVGEVWTTVSGRQLRMTRDGPKPVLAQAAGVGPHQNPFSDAVDFLISLFSGRSRSVAALGAREGVIRGPGSLRSIQKDWAASQTTLDGRLDEAPKPPELVTGTCLAYVKDIVLATTCQLLAATGDTSLGGMDTDGKRVWAGGHGNVFTHTGGQVVARDGAGFLGGAEGGVATSRLSNAGNGVLLVPTTPGAVLVAGAQMTTPDGTALRGLDGRPLIGNDGSTLIGNDGSTLIGNDGSTLIGNDGSTLKLPHSAGLVPPGALP